MKKREAIEGIIPPTVTPLKEGELLDKAGVRNLIDYCIKRGVTGIFCNGTSGEAMRLTDRVWAQNTETTLVCVDGRVPVFCGAIDSSTSRTLEKVKEIGRMGGKYAVCTAPFYLRSFGQDEILRHFDRICQKTDLSIVVYNIPETTQVNIWPETIAEMAKWGRIAAYKDSCADYQQLQREMILLEDTDVSLLNGAEELCAAAMLFGAQGCIPGLANFVPELFVALWEACQRGEIEETYRLQKRIVEVRKVLQVNGCWMSAMKYLLKALGMGEDEVSFPLQKLNPEERRIADGMLRRAGLRE